MRPEFSAANPKLATQMGNQVSSAPSNRSGVKWLREGIVGKVTSVHSVNQKSWGQLGPLRGEVVDPPAYLDWEIWNGVRPRADYIERAYHPSQWRKRLDYGTGTLGDMGCHIYDPTFKALGLTYPISLKSEGPVPNKDNWGFDAKIHYIFPKTGYCDENHCSILCCNDG